VAVPGGLSFTQISAGFAHFCGVTSENRAYCWGDNVWGQLGNGSEASADDPVPVAGGLRFRQVAAGLDHTCGRTTENRLYCWGSNDWGELGDGTQGVSRLVPVPVAGGRFYRHVDAAANGTCAVTTGYLAFCWGDNGNGQVGDSTRGGIRTVPVAVAGGRRFRQVDRGSGHTCGLTTDARIYCWGANWTGQLGIGRVGFQRKWPGWRVLSGQSFSRVSAGGDHTCAETIYNRAYCWGANRTGQLGDGTLTLRSTPVAVVGGLFFKQLVTAGWSEGHSCGITSDRVAYCWGLNSVGELGDGTRIDRRTPTPVVGPSEP
jgi:alpha-tubulin suppressor-like RCC1 family protein